MRWLFTTRRQSDRRIRARDERIGQLLQRVEEAEAKAKAAALDAVEVEAKRRNLARWLAQANAANARLSGRVDELIRQAESTSFEDSAALKNKIRHLQKRLDDAVGLAGRVPEDSGRWQPGYKQPGVDA